MAKSSKRRPWAVEMKPPGSDKFYEVDAYADEASAAANAKLMRDRAPEATVRYRNTTLKQLAE